MGFFIFSTELTFQLVVAILFWVVFVLMLICHFIVGKPRSPLIQKELPSFEIGSSDFYIVVKEGEDHATDQQSEA